MTITLFFIEKTYKILSKIYIVFFFFGKIFLHILYVGITDDELQVKKYQMCKTASIEEKLNACSHTFIY